MKVIKFVVPAILVVWLILFLILSFVVKKPGYYIFADISECEAIKMSKLDGARFESYDPHEKDDNLKDLNFEKSFCGKFTCDDFEFEIFAYEFSASETAKAYFVSETGKTDNPDTTFSGSWGATNGRFIVLDSERVYQIKSKSKYRDDIFEFLSEIFSKEI